MRRDKEDRATNAPQYIFGPVVSGRLGLSLGLDLLGARICTFDCLYCEAGATEALTVSRKPYVPVRRIRDELAAVKATGVGPLDAVTLGGMGEPTLNTDCGEIIAAAKELFPDVPVAVLTNSSLLPDPDVRAALSQADIVLPSMDTLVASEFRQLNRPSGGIALETIRQGLLEFRAGYDGSLFLEVLLLAGINDTEQNLALLRDFCRELDPTRVDVVTMTRPGAYPGASAVSAEVLSRFQAVLGTPGEMPSGVPAGHGPAALIRRQRAEDLAARIAASLKRRPQTAAGLALALGASQDQVQAVLAGLVRTGKIHLDHSGQDVFYSGQPG